MGGAASALVSALKPGVRATAFRYFSQQTDQEVF